MAGVYEVFLIQRESRSVSKYRKLVESFDELTEGKSPLEIEKLVKFIFKNKIYSFIIFSFGKI